VGAFHLSHYAYALFAFGLPTLLIVSATFFALATATRSMMWTYVGAVGVLVLYLVMRGLLRDPQYDSVSALADPFGLSALTIATKYWTAAERNTQLPALAGPLLANRLIWAGVGLALFAWAYRVFRFEQKPGKAKAAAAQAEAAEAAVPRPGTLPAPRTDGATRRTQLMRLVRFDMAFVFRSPAFFVLLGIGVLNSGGSLWFSGEMYGSGSYPVPRLMVQTLQGAFTLMPIIIAIFYAGELVWRDRERRLHEIVDATAAPDWSHLLPKVLAITVVLTVSALVAVVTALVVQTLKGYFHYDLAGYLLWFVLPTTVAAVQLAVLAVFVQVLVPQKFIGWGVMLLYLVSTIALGNAGFEHNLYNYGGTPPVPLSDMNRMGRFWIGASWFLAYWSAFALVLAVLAHALWRRGATLALKPRLKQLPARLKGGAGLLLGAGLAAWAGMGVWIFYNTNVLNAYLPEPEREALQAELEKALLPFEKLPQPKITSVTLDVQLFPKEARAVTTGRYEIENRSGAPIEQLHVNWFNPWETLDRLELPGATLEKEYPKFHYRIYRLQPALQPGEKRTLSFQTTVQQRGFGNGQPLTRIVDNGSFLDNTEIAPGIGMSRNPLLKDRAKRRKHGLPPDLRPPKLEDDSARAFNEFDHQSDWVTADITVTTDADQTPIAPGYTVSDTVANGRRTVHFRPDAPLNNFFSIQSARYAVQRDKWKDVDLAVYYHPEHAYNVQRMMEAMKLSLSMFSERFTPYQFRQARILEFPAYADFAQSFANTIPYSENIGFISHHTDPEKVDLVTYVTAHEIAHQWWGHQLVPADQQGASMLVESFAQYSALLVMEKMYGREQVRRFTKYELDRYLRSRGGEVVEELPLARVEEQGYIHYRKGTLVMYWLREALGEDTVNHAMKKLLEQYAFKPAPYPNTRDFIALLRAEAGSQHDPLITDLLEKITLLDVKVTDASATKRPDGKYEVTLQVEARKLYADGQGKETEAPLDEPFEVGVFTAEPGKADFKADSVLRFERRPIKTGKQTITLVVEREPKFVGVDPYNKRIDRNSDDNLKRVALK
jgi:ABC-2 type transport system permease protein